MSRRQPADNFWQRFNALHGFLGYSNSLLDAIDGFRASFGPVEVTPFGKVRQGEYTVFDGSQTEVGSIQPPRRPAD